MICADCHVEQAAGHAASRHASAASSPIFLAAWEAWPNGWCLGCHAPDVPATPGALQPDRRAALPASRGVGCPDCHGDAPHETGPVGVDVCASCHQFPFQRHDPPWPFALGDTPAQDTVAEWTAWRAGGGDTGCVGCHLDGHRFPGGHDPARVRAALTVTARREPGGVRAWISAPDAGHRVPTGDPFRRLIFTVCADAACAQPLDDLTLRRLFAVDPASWTLVDDRTVPPGGTRELFVPTAAPAAGWRLEYRYGDPRFEPLLPPEEVGYVVASGILE
jgi:hypothetical protein